MGRSRSLHPQKGNTQYGLEVQSWLHSPPSNKCGSRNKNMTNLVLELYTENASKSLFSVFECMSTKEMNTKNSLVSLCHLNNLGLPSYHVLQKKTTTTIFQ